MFISVQLLFLFLVFIYETPKGSLLKKDREQCIKMLNYMFKDQERIEKEIVNIENVLEETVYDFYDNRKEMM